MRERATAVGGSVETGPAPDGGFQVTARLPAACAGRGAGQAPDDGQDAPPAAIEEATAMVRVVLADDQALIRAGFPVLVNAADDLQVVGEATDGDQAVRLARSECADVVLMDIRMPGWTAWKRPGASQPTRIWPASR